jgi:hypothetical protein
MKKFFYILAVVITLSTLSLKLYEGAVESAKAQQAQEDCERGTSYSDAEKCLPFSPGRIFSKMNVTLSGGKDWTDVFGSDDPTRVGQNLYAKIYDKTIHEPEIKAVENITGRYAVSEAEMTRLLSGNFQPLLARKPTLTQREAAEKLDEIHQQFQEEKEILQLQADLNAEVQPNEMFFNGNIDDSGFDIINDLSLIEKILFLKSDPITIGADFNDEFGSNAGSGTGGSGSTSTGTQSGPASQSSQSTPGQDQSQTGSTTASGSGTSSPGSQQGSTGQSETGSQPNSLNPNSCFGADTLDQALANFDQNKADNPAYKDQSEKSSAGTLQNSGGGTADSDGTTGASNEGNGTETGQKEDVSGSNLLPNIIEKPIVPTPAEAFQWIKNLPCNDVFCLSTSFSRGTTKTYQNSDNCIACHIEKINEKVKETINHNLLPGKLTGNVLEPAICKKAAVNNLNSVGLNFYVQTQPVMTPANNDLIYGVGIENEWNKYVSTYKPFPFDEKKPFQAQKDGQEQFPQKELDRATLNALTQAPDVVNFDQINKQIQEELEINSEKREEAAKVAAISQQSDNDLGFYQAIRREIAQMNYYFESFQKTLQSLHEQVEGMTGGQACNELRAKTVCQ